MSGANPQNQQTTPPPAAPAPQAAAQAPEVPQAPQAPAPVAATHTFIVNGENVTDFGRVQSYINTLETFRTETIENTRREFVTQLAKDNKILATQINDLQAFALDLSNEQFDKWKASYDAAPATSLTANHGATPGDQSAPSNGADTARNQEIATLKEIVQSHRDAGLSQEQIESKDSYKKLQALLSEGSGQQA